MVRPSCCASSFLCVSEGSGDLKIRGVVVREWPVRWSGCLVSIVFDGGSGAGC